MNIRVFNEETNKFIYYLNAKKVLSRRNEELFIVRENGNDLFFKVNQVNVSTGLYDAMNLEIYTGDIIQSIDTYSPLSFPNVVFIFDDEPSILVNGEIKSLYDISLKQTFVVNHVFNDLATKNLFESDFEHFKEKNYDRYFVVVASKSENYKEASRLGYAYCTGKESDGLYFGGGAYRQEKNTLGIITGLTEALQTIPRKNLTRITLNTTSQFVADIIDKGTIHLWYNKGWVKNGPAFGEVEYKDAWNALRNELLGREIEVKVIDYDNKIYKMTQNEAEKHFASV